jgi:hypothetical protein
MLIIGTFFHLPPWGIEGALKKSRLHFATGIFLVQLFKPLKLIERIELIEPFERLKPHKPHKPHKPLS